MKKQDRENMSLAEKVALLPKEKRDSFMADFSDQEKEALVYNWDFWARPKQKLPPGKWLTWLILAGRGFGKTRTGAETVRRWADENPNVHIALIGRTVADIRSVMLEGESGLLNICNPENRPTYIVSKKLVLWPNGAQAHLYSDEDPEQLRGPQHHKAWVDELCKFKNADDVWDMMEFGLRLGDNPQCIVTTTPKPTKIIKAIVKDEDTYITKGSTFENVGNLAESFIKRVIKKYEGTRLGRQELEAELLDDVAGALWKRDQLDLLRVKKVEVPELVRIVVAIDPAVTCNEKSDFTGIVAVGMSVDKELYVLADESLKDSPNGWAKKAVDTFENLQCDRIIGEANNGGDLIETVIRTVDPDVPYTKVHASRGKLTRAEPIAALYEQKKVHHVGYFPDLEDEMCEWIPGEGKSPNRVDALVWAITELRFGGSVGEPRIRQL